MTDRQAVQFHEGMPTERCFDAQHPGWLDALSRPNKKHHWRKRANLHGFERSGKGSLFEELA